MYNEKNGLSVVQSDDLMLSRHLIVVMDRTSLFEGVSAQLSNSIWKSIEQSITPKTKNHTPEKAECNKLQQEVFASLEQQHGKHSEYPTFDLGRPASEFTGDLQQPAAIATGRPAQACLAHGFCDDGMPQLADVPQPGTERNLTRGRETEERAGEGVPGDHWERESVHGKPDTGYHSRWRGEKRLSLLEQQDMSIIIQGDVKGDLITNGGVKHVHNHYDQPHDNIQSEVKKPVQMPPHLTQPEAVNLLRFLTEKGYIAPTTDADAFLYLMGVTSEVPPKLKPVNWLLTQQQLRVMLVLAYKPLLDQGALKKAELERRVPFCFLVKGKKIAKLAKNKPFFNFEQDALEEYFRRKYE